MADVKVILTDEVRGNGMALQAVFLQQCALCIAVGLIGFGDFKVIAPAGEFHAVIAKRFGFLQNGGGGHVRPLAGEESDGSRHGSQGSFSGEIEFERR